MKRLILSLLQVLIGPGAIWANEDYQAGEFKSGGHTLRYRWLEPAKLENGLKYPLVLFLHGAGERGDDNRRQLVHGSSLFTNPAHRAKFPCYVLFPQCPEGKRWVEVDWSEKTSHKQPAEPSEPMKLTRALMDRFLADHPVDRQRIYVMGLSMGGFGTWDLAARYPELPAAIVPICGGADDRTAGKLKEVAIWVFHGADDGAVAPARSRSMVAELRRIGHEHLRYTEYPNVGHGSWDPAFAERELLPWLFTQKQAK